MLYPLSEIVIPGIISFTKGSHRSKVDGQEKIFTMIFIPFGQLLKSVCFSLVSQETQDSLNVDGE